MAENAISMSLNTRFLGLFDYDRRSGLQAGDWRPYADKLLKLADERGLQFVQAHAPMGSPLAKNGQYESFMQLTKQSI